TYLPVYWASECVWPFASASEKSGAALPTGGGSKAKAATAISDVRTVKVTFLFINELENDVVKLVQFSSNQHTGKEQEEHKCGGFRPRQPEAGVQKNLIVRQHRVPQFGVFPEPCLL